jgi:predicted transcriptional regulator
MKKPMQSHLSRREREIMDLVHRLGEASVRDVQGLMEDDPGYDSVRVTLGILRKKGHVKHRREGRCYVYSPTVPHERATRSALRGVLRTFFGGSASRAILTMLDMSSERLSKRELDEIAAFIEEEKDR